MKKSVLKTILIAGLGNPGEKYENTPHNAGFLVVNQLGSTYDAKFTIHTGLESEIAEVKLNRKKFIFAKPQNFMNNSGTAVKKIVSSFKVQISGIWIIHDDMDLALGQIKIVRNRGSAGHKGVEDIMKKLKTKDFVRFRIGIRPAKIPAHRPKTLMNKFVISTLNGAEKKFFDETIKRCTEAVQLAFDQGIEKSASVYNK